MTDPIKTVEEYIAWTKELKGGLVLYRGLPNSDWEVESSAHRRIRNSEAMSSETVPALTFQNYIHRLLDEASLQGFRKGQGRTLSDLELLAELQHYGAATCLIDFTTSALIALWFACQEEQGQYCKVVAMATDSIERFSTIRYEDMDKPIKKFLSQGKLWKWEPSDLNSRIVAQQSVFLFGEGKIERSLYEEISVAASCKEEIVGILEESFGISGPKLFRDLSGFAHHNAHDIPYTKFSSEDYLSLGTTLHQRGDYREAIEHYGRALKLDPGSALAYFSRGTARDALRDHQGAIADLDKAIERNPQEAEPYNNRGNAKLALSDLPGAIADYDKAIELNPILAEPFYNRGNTRSALGDSLGAIADYDKAIDLNRQNGSYYSGRGYARLALGDYPGAIADYDNAISLNPPDGATYHYRGYSKHALGDYPGAIADFDIAIRLNSDFAGSYNFRGNAKLALGDYSGAISDYDKVIKLYPQDSAAYYNRGNARQAMGYHLDAIADFDRAINLNPQNAAAYYGRGLARTATNEAEGARQDFSRANELDNNLRRPEQ